MTHEEESQAFTAPIYHSLLDVLTFWPGVPFQAAIGVIVATLAGLVLVVMAGWMSLIWRILLVGAAVYAGLFFLTRKDPQRCMHFVRYLTYPPYLGVG